MEQEPQQQRHIARSFELSNRQTPTAAWRLTSVKSARATRMRRVPKRRLSPQQGLKQSRAEASARPSGATASL